MKIVLQKHIADSGHCSRRQAEDLIRNGKVLVNGKVAELGMRVDEQDKVEVDKKIIKPVKEKIYIKINKPIGYTCTNRSFKGEKNVFELKSLLSSSLQKEGILRSLSVVGRLDKNSRGLVILTNDGDWAEKIAHPRYKKEKEYIIEIKNQNTKIKMILEKFKKGIDIGEEDGVVRAKGVDYLGDDKFKIILTQGKKRQIRRMFDAFGIEVVDLKRIGIGNISLGGLKEGGWEYLKM